MDIVGGIVLADGTECKGVAGVDDHSRNRVMAAVGGLPHRPGGLPSMLNLINGHALLRPPAQADHRH
ncbi:hypothetical protein [Actinomadura montaniterrae]|uniref:Uncharacterized protein n=1 Tax=Actinomadura montaniterrae TaxID=1803903 RepID=A0A6L3VN04_9ACTN|nr:hypothetical protein [Actinomadura montaniterrae]KAB2369652.1 hypothetical protein F9B16_36540 [Actinomadura montaniterrae]